MYRQTEEAVRQSLSGVEPKQAGAFLSGGTDSSTVVGLMSRVTGERVQAFSIGFQEARYNELDYAELAARHFDAAHYTKIVTADEALQSLPDLVAAYDEPFGNNSALAAYLCARLARETGVRVLLAGDGGAWPLRILDHPGSDAPFLTRFLGAASDAQALPTATMVQSVLGKFPYDSAPWEDMMRDPNDPSQWTGFRIRLEIVLHNLVHDPLVTRRECRDCVLATIACEDEPARFRDERTCHSHEARYRFNVPISRAVDHVDGIVTGMCDVDPIRGWMNIGVIEAAIGSMCREFDVAQ